VCAPRRGATDDASRGTLTTRRAISAVALSIDGELRQNVAWDE
jgi:hypothetical protein